MAGYVEDLKEGWAKKSTLLCFGMDPEVERMKTDPSKNLTDEIVRFFFRIFCEIKERVSAVKPNVAFFYQYGIEGVHALFELVKKVKSSKVPVIVDAKHADIGKTSAAYARYVFNVLGGDAVTLNPYLGYDSLAPFFDYKDRECYVLALTSNEGSGDFQTEKLERGLRLCEYMLYKICEWNRSHGTVGAVVGATRDAFVNCIRYLTDNRCMVPLLVPGVGAQGGSYLKTIDILEQCRYELGVVRINASSSISYARERFTSLTVEGAAAAAVEEILSS